MRSCACGCGESLAGRRSDARYYSDACRALASDIRRGRRVEKPQTRSIQIGPSVPWALLALTYGTLLGILST